MDRWIKVKFLLIRMSVRKTLDHTTDSSKGCKNCVNHGERAATHQLVSKSGHSDMFYCEKCSIMLASQGFTVMKLSASALRNCTSLTKADRPKKIQSKAPSRRTQIDAFTKNLAVTLELLQEKDQALQQYLMGSQNDYGVAIQAANSFYKQLEQIIQLQKYTTYNAILNHRANQQTQIRQFKSQIQEYIEEVASILDDIRQNMDAVETADYPIYAEIMMGYKLKLQAIDEIRDMELNLRSYRSKFEIILPEIPKNFYTISEKISLSLKTSQFPTNQNSMTNFLQPQRIVAEDQNQNLDSSCSSGTNSNIFLKENLQDQGNSFAISDKIVKKVGNTDQLAFSFDQSNESSKQFRPTPQISNEPSLRSRLIKNSRATEKLNFCPMVESRQSLGDYLNISRSRERNSIEDTDTLLIL